LSSHVIQFPSNTQRLLKVKSSKRNLYSLTALVS
jgi:hypothetical protein